MPPPADVEDGSVVLSLADMALSIRLWAEVHNRRIERIRESDRELSPSRRQLCTEIADAEDRGYAWIAGIMPDPVHGLGHTLDREAGQPHEPVLVGHFDLDDGGLACSRPVLRC